MYKFMVVDCSTSNLSNNVIYLFQIKLLNVTILSLFSYKEYIPYASIFNYFKKGYLIVLRCPQRLSDKVLNLYKY